MDAASGSLLSTHICTSLSDKTRERLLSRNHNAVMRLTAVIVDVRYVCLRSHNGKVPSGTTRRPLVNSHTARSKQSIRKSGAHAKRTSGVRKKLDVGGSVLEMARSSWEESDWEVVPRETLGSLAGYRFCELRHLDTNHLSKAAYEGIRVGIMIKYCAKP